MFSIEVFRVRKTRGWKSCRKNIELDRGEKWRNSIRRLLHVPVAAPAFHFKMRGHNRNKIQFTISKVHWYSDDFYFYFFVGWSFK